eukprot:1461874-Pyramimonas_sp.AAC.1
MRVGAHDATVCVQIECGARHTAALTSSGQLYVWGFAMYGQLARPVSSRGIADEGRDQDSDVPSMVKIGGAAGSEKIECVSCGAFHTHVVLQW